MGSNPLQTALYTLRKAAEIADLDPLVTELLSRPKRTMEFVFPLRMDNNEIRIFTGFRVHWSDALGTIKDGVRFTDNLDLEELKALALWMTIKHGVGGIPAGGGKGGVIVDPAKLSRWELERLCRNYMRHIPYKGAWSDVHGADIGTDEQTQAWMLDEYESLVGYHCPAAVNDKPVAVNGTHGSSEATGLGLFYIIEQVMKDFSVPHDCNLAIQGYGKVGSGLANKLFEEGFRVVAVSDIFGGIYSPDGIDCIKLDQYVKETGSVIKYPNAEPITNSQLLALKVDILIPAATQSVINEANANTIQAKIIIEAANGPVTTEAEKYLLKNNLVIIPDVVANVGSAIVCHFERIQGLSENYWEIAKVRDLLEKWILRAYREMMDTAKETETTFRIAAWVNALRKIEAAIKTRGWV